MTPDLSYELEGERRRSAKIINGVSKNKKKTTARCWFWEGAVQSLPLPRSLPSSLPISPLPFLSPFLYIVPSCPRLRARPCPVTCAFACPYRHALGCVFAPARGCLRARARRAFACAHAVQHPGSSRAARTTATPALAVDGRIGRRLELSGEGGAGSRALLEIFGHGKDERCSVGE